jgi:AhpD family alkylhydroperoxidase
MKPRMDFAKLNPKILQSLMGLAALVEDCGLEPKLLHLIMMRASQINGCAPCIDIHTKEARAAGETEQRLYGLDAWREAPYYSERERAALAWTEALTLVAATHAPDEVYEAVRRQFTENETANLTFAIAVINTWNRLNVALRSVAGDYRPGMYRAGRVAAAG